MVFGLEGIVLAIVALWLLALSFFSLRMINHYNRLVKGTKEETLKSVLDMLVSRTDKSEKDIDFLKQLCDRIERDGMYHIQKIGLVRFNPFKDTGGDQSFILSLLDGHNTGVVISGLYSRSGTRWYAKTVKGGKGIEHELSEDEKRALKEARYIEKT